MHPRLNQAILGASLLTILACSGGGDSKAPTIVTGPGYMPSTTTPVFDPANANVPLPNVLATATAADPLTGRAANKPMTPPEALAYVNLHEMGGTNAVSGLNAPVYIQFNAAVDATTVTAANIKVFQLTPDAAGTENAALGFTDISGMFSYNYAAGTKDLFLFPSFPLLPGTRYLYVVTNRVKDTAGKPISASPYFEALKSLTPLGGSFGALEPIRANVTSGGTILFSGYAKVMNDLITASATTTIAQRSDITVMGRFITTGAGAISLTTTSPSATGASLLPVESALRSYAAGSNIPGNLPAKTWSNTITVTATFDRGGTNPSPDVYWAAAMTAAGLPVTPAPATVGTVVLGKINSADLSMDPVVVAAHAATNDLTGITGAYNPAAGVTQAFRPDGLHLAGFYSTDRQVPFVYIAPTAAAPSGGYPLVIYAHGIGGQKEHALAVAQSLTTIGRAVIAIDEPLHGELAVPGHTTGAAWFQDFAAYGAPLALRSNVQQAAFNLNRLELTVRTGGFAGLGATMPSMADIKFVGHSLGSIIGTYYLAGNTTLSTTGYPYTQTSLNTDMKGYLSVPAGRWGYIGLDSTSTFEPIVTAGLAAVGITKNTPTYYQFFLVTQSILDPTDPASMTTPLASGLPSRLSGRVAMQEAVGETSIPNPYTRYLGNALGGRAVLGTSAAAAIAPGFKQLAYTAGGTPAHTAGVPAQFMFTITGGALAPKVANAAVALSDTTPTEGYFQFDQTGINHNSLIDPTNLVNLGLIQRQMRYFMGFTGASIVVDPTQGTALPIAPGPFVEMQLPNQFTILGH
ncbi:Ig-like domain-containing protein [Geothrix oryzisoli]|uniref:Ig-like domain-containing protein n=1 Tax=Geothrix oryzisoli TaxID=2922721 RepID=UPI001FAE47A6|nr:Ig-like domain-containing protein [Geothrix oryzisoli]